MYGGTSNSNYGAFFQNKDTETDRYRKELLEQVRYKKQLEAEENIGMVAVIFSNLLKNKVKLRKKLVLKGTCVL